MAVALLAPPLEAQQTRQVKVVVQFQQSGARAQETLGGGVTITRKGGVQGSAEQKQTTAQHTAAIFTLVQDGGDSSMLVATRVPTSEVIFYQNYLSGAGYFVIQPAFREVGTALRIQAEILPRNEIRVRLMPRISYFSYDGGGAIDVTEAATELIVSSGQPVLLGSATTEMHEVTRRILGFHERQSASESSVVLTATIQ
jgi:hypothetical protein